MAFQSSITCDGTDSIREPMYLKSPPLYAYAQNASAPGENTTFQCKTRLRPVHTRHQRCLSPVHPVFMRFSFVKRSCTRGRTRQEACPSPVHPVQTRFALRSRVLPTCRRVLRCKVVFPPGADA